MARIKIGDIVEIKTSKGVAYALYTHRHQQYGALLRVFGRIHEVAPNDLITATDGEPAFSVFFPLSAAVNKKIVSIVDNISVPPSLKPFPTFRTGVVDPSTGKVGTWWLWDGEKEWRLGTLKPEHRKLSFRGICNDTFLIELLETGWTPENDPR